jgi:DNA-binding CsgD family transcriptional regulator
MAMLEIFAGVSRELITLQDGAVTVGRSADAEITLADQNVSRVHAKLTPVAGRWTVEDLGSKNGTWVKGERVFGERVLQDGDEIKVGGTTVVFRDPSAAHESSTIKKDTAPDVTRRERDVLVELCRPIFAAGLVKRAATVREIADAMFTGEAAVKQHLGHLYDKFLIPEAGTNRRDLLAEAAIECGAVGRANYDSGSE